MQRILSHLLRPISRLVELPMKRLLGFFVKSTLGRFLRHDVKFEQFCLNLQSGEAELCDVELNTDEFHRVFEFDFPNVCRLFVHSIHIEMFGQEGCLKIAVKGIVIEIEMDQCFVDNVVAHDSNSFESQNSLKFREENDLEGFEDEDLSNAARSGLNSLGDWIDAYTANLQLDMEDITIIFYRRYSKEKSLQVLIPKISMRDDSETLSRTVLQKRFDMGSMSFRAHDGDASFVFGSTSETCEGSARIDTQTVSTFHGTVPWARLRLTPEVVSILVGIFASNQSEESFFDDLVDIDGDQFYDGMDMSFESVEPIKEVKSEAPPKKLRIQLEILRVQIECIYAKRLPNLPAFDSPSYLMEWLHASSVGQEAIRQWTDFENVTDCVEQLIIRSQTMVFRVNNTDGIDVAGMFGVDKIHAFEILRKSPLSGEKIAFLHQLVDFDTSQTQACTIQFVKSQSIVVQLAPLLVSWDNAFEKRMNWYLPEAPTTLPEPSQTTVDNTSSGYSLSFVSPKMLLVARIPESIHQVDRWKSQALILNISEVEASTGHVLIDAPELDLSTISLDEANENGNVGHRISDPLFRELHAERVRVWENVIDFGYARACIQEVPTGKLTWDILPDNHCWSVTVGVNTDDSKSKIVAPRLIMSLSLPLTNMSQVDRLSQKSFEIAHRHRRAFKTRNFERSQSKFDPAGDHDIDKDQMPALHQRIERTIAHGYVTSESCVRLVCPTATIRLDRRVYQSFNATLQLILGTLPTMMQNPEGDLEAPGGPQNVDAFSPKKFQSGFQPRTDEFGMDNRVPARCFFQLHSHEGSFEILQEDNIPSYVFQYYGLQLSQIDDKTTIESSDITFVESGESPTSILYSTKWGRTDASPPLLQIFHDAAPIGEDEMSILNICVETLTFHYLPQSNWLTHLGKFFSAPPTNGSIVRTEPQDQCEEDLGSIRYTELNVEFFDSIIRYAPSIADGYGRYPDCLLVFGLFRVSSNIASQIVQDQSYHLTARDITMFISDQAATCTKHDHWCKTTLPSASRTNTAEIFSSIENFVTSMMYAKVSSINMAEIFVRLSETSNFSSAPLDVEVSIPDWTMYTCADSLLTLQTIGQSLVSEIQDQVTVEEWDEDCEDEIADNIPGVPVAKIDTPMEMKPASVAQASSPSAKKATLEPLDTFHITPDDEKSAGELRKAYLDSSTVPDDMLSGPQLRRRHQIEQDGDDILIDGFCAVSAMPSAGMNLASLPMSPTACWYDVNPGTSEKQSLVWGDNGEEIELEEIRFVDLPERSHLADQQLEQARLAEEEEQRFAEEEARRLSQVQNHQASGTGSAAHHEPKAGWFDDEEVKIYPHYMGVPYEAGPGSHVPPAEALAARLEPHPQVGVRHPLTARLILRDLSIKWFLFGGSEWNASVGIASTKPDETDLVFTKDEATTPETHRERLKGVGRDMHKMLEVQLQHISACIDRHSHGPFAQRIYLAIRDFEVLDHIDTSEINKMACEWVSQSRHPRITGSSMLRVSHDIVNLRKDPERAPHLLRVALLPLKLNLDQDALDFVLEFFSMQDILKPPEQLQDITDEDDADLCIIPSSSGLPIFSTVDIRACKLRLDYRPKRISLNAMMKGDRMAFVNMFAYEGLEVSVCSVQLGHVRGFEHLVASVYQSWSSDISRQSHKCLAGVSFPPINTLAALGNGLTSLVMVPLEQYQRDGRIIHGMQRGIYTFSRAMAVEVLGTFSRATQTAHMLLGHARDVVTAQQTDKRLTNQHRSPDRADLSWDLTNFQPTSFYEGLEYAAESFQRDVKQAAYVLVAVPLDQFREQGTTSAIKAVLRGVPVAVIRPLMGATQLVSSSLIGLRNSVDPDIRYESVQKYKNTSHPS